MGVHYENVVDYSVDVSCRGNDLHYDYLLDVIKVRNNYLINEIISQPYVIVDSESVGDYLLPDQKVSNAFRHPSIYHYYLCDLVNVVDEVISSMLNHIVITDSSNYTINYMEIGDSFKSMVFMPIHSIRSSHCGDFSHFYLL